MACPQITAYGLACNFKPCRNHEKYRRLTVKCGGKNPVSLLRTWYALEITDYSAVLIALETRCYFLIASDTNQNAEAVRCAK